MPGSAFGPVSGAPCRYRVVEDDHGAAHVSRRVCGLERNRASDGKGGEGDYGGELHLGGEIARLIIVEEAGVCWVVRRVVSCLECLKREQFAV